MSRALFVLTGFLAAASSGCVTEIESTACSPLTVVNGAFEDVKVQLHSDGGKLVLGIGVNDGDTVTANIPAGTFKVLVTGEATDAVLFNYDLTAACDVAQELRIQPAAEADISNDTGEALTVSIDGYVQNELNPGETGRYFFPGGSRHIEVILGETGEVMLDQTVAFDPNHREVWSVTADAPIVVVQNLRPAEEDGGIGQDCVYVIMDEKTLVHFQGAKTTLCGWEQAAIWPKHGDHQFEFREATFGLPIKTEAWRHYSENTVTVFQIW